MTKVTPIKPKEASLEDLLRGSIVDVMSTNTIAAELSSTLGFFLKTDEQGKKVNVDKYDRLAEKSKIDEYISNLARVTVGYVTDLTGEDKLKDETIKLVQAYLKNPKSYAEKPKERRRAQRVLAEIKQITGLDLEGLKEEKTISATDMQARFSESSKRLTQYLVSENASASKPFVKDADATLNALNNLGKPLSIEYKKEDLIETDDRIRAFGEIIGSYLSNEKLRENYIKPKEAAKAA